MDILTKIITMAKNNAKSKERDRAIAAHESMNRMFEDAEMRFDKIKLLWKK